MEHNIDATGKNPEAGGREEYFSARNFGKRNFLPIISSWVVRISSTSATEGFGWLAQGFRLIFFSLQMAKKISFAFLILSSE